MSIVRGGRVKVRRDDDPTPLVLLVRVEVQNDGSERSDCRLLETNEACDSVDSDTWRIRGSDRKVHRVEHIA